VTATGSERNDDRELRERDDEVALSPGAHQDQRGVDRSLIRYCLRLTPTQRMAENESALALTAGARQATTPGPAAATAGAEPAASVPGVHGTR
jgi:hypothetical protein